MFSFLQTLLSFLPCVQNDALLQSDCNTNQEKILKAEYYMSYSTPKIEKHLSVEYKNFDLG